MLLLTDNHRTYIIFFLVLLPLSIARAQTSGSYFRHLTADDGLSQSSIYAIVQDTSGFLWFGTKDGLDRYDGYHFKAFVHSSHDTSSLSNDFVTVLYRDRKGRMWVGTEYGQLDLYDPRLDNFRALRILKASQRSYSINAITEDANGNIWVGTTGDGLIEVSIDSNRTGVRPNRDDISFRYSVTTWDSTNTKTLRSNVVSSLLRDEDGSLWAGVAGRVFSFETLHGKMILASHHFLLPPGTTNPIVLSLYQDSTGRIWAGTNVGLFDFNRRKDLFVPYFRDDRPEDRDLSGIRSICEDSQGNLWVGTFASVFRLDLRNHKSRLMLRGEDGAICIKCDRSGTVWIGTNGNGLYVYTPNATHFESFTKKTASGLGWPGESIRSIFQDSRGRLWIGSYGGLFVANPALNSFRKFKSKMIDPVRSIVQDSSGRLWFASDYGVASLSPRSGAVRYFRHRPGDPSSLASSIASAVFLDPHGTIWAVTPGVLNRLNGKSGAWSRYYFNKTSDATNDPPPTSVCEPPGGSIWLTSLNGLWRFNTTTKTFRRYMDRDATLSICPDPSEPSRYLWIGTDGAGLARLDIRTGVVTSFTESDGLPDNVVYGVLSDAEGNLWISTNNGLAKFNPVSRQVVCYTHANGLQGDEYNSGAYFKSPEGEFFFGGIYGFDAFWPGRERHDNYDPPVVITGIYLFNKPLAVGGTPAILSQSVHETRSIALDYRQNVLSLRFASLDFTAPWKNMYEYRLVGFDPRFIRCGTSRSVTYTNLDPGKYIFIARGTNSAGKWSGREVRLLIHVLPPFWMTWWFRGMLIIGLIALGSIAYVIRVSRLKRDGLRQQLFSRQLIESQENERRRIAVELHDSLGQNLLIIKNKLLGGAKRIAGTDEIRALFDDVTGVVSSSIQEVRDISQNLRPHHLDQLGLTLAIESVIDTVAGSTNIEIVSDIENVDGLVPADSQINFFRIVQEGLNNVIKHSNADRASVVVRKLKDRIVLSIEDDGTGIDEEYLNGKEGCLGIVGMRERAQILGGQISFSTGPDRGTILRLVVPVDREI